MTTNSSLAQAQSIADLRRLAKRRLPRSIFDFFDGGAEDEQTLFANADAFGVVRMLPKVLVDVAKIDPSTQLLGGPSALPLAIAPMGALGLGWRGADVALAKAATAAGVPYIMSSAANDSLEEVARHVSGRLWFQPYMLQQHAFVDRWLERAEGAGYDALVITLDLPVSGKRERDLRNHFSLPFRWTLRNVLDFASRPAWSLDMLMRGPPALGNMAGLDKGPSTMKNAGATVGRSIDASFDERRFEHIRAKWKGKLIAKGVMRPDDARRLVSLGCDAIVVSNHGGRQFDAASSTLAALPAVVEAVGQQAQVLMDGGVRRGRHVVQALALGASGVLVGRSMLYGLAAAGEPGARRALEILQDEIVRSMRLCGVRDTSEIDAGLLAPR